MEILITLLKIYNDYILKKYEDSMNNILDEYLDNNVLQEDEINQINNKVIEINAIYVFYKTPVNETPTYTLYLENNFNIMNIHNLDITESNFINGFDLAHSLFYAKYSIFIEFI